LFGSALLGLSLFRRDQGCRRGARQLLAVVALGAPTLTVACLVPVAAAGYAMAAAREQAARGDWAAALTQLGLAEACLPILAYQTDLVYQRGWLEERCRRSTPAARLVSAWQKEAQNFEEISRQEYAGLLSPKIPEPVRSEAFRGLLRLAIDDFNSGRIDRAHEGLSRLAAADPSSLTALYGLQMTDLHGNRLMALRRDLAQLTAVYHVFQSNEKLTVLALCRQHLAELAFDQPNAAMVDQQLPLLTRPKNP
jgi:hypothetical protein